MPPTQNDQHDLTALTNLLLAIGGFLQWIVTDSPFVPQDLRPGFREVLPIVNSRLETAGNELGTIIDTGNPLWQRLDDAGLVGVPLRLKLAIWRRTTATVSAPPPAPGGFVGRALRPLMKLINSILGSLASVFPLLELAKEYKDGVELVIEHQQEGNPPPIDIFRV